MNRSTVTRNASLLALALLLGAGCVSTQPSPALLRPREPGIVVYPDNVANPRVPTVRPEAKGAKGACMEIDAEFAYPLAPLLNFPAGGAATWSLRDSARRTVKTPLALEDGKTTLAVVIAPASEGRKVRLTLTIDKKEVVSAKAANPPNPGWDSCTLRWSATEAVLESGGTAVASVKLPAGFNPKRMTVEVYHIDELVLKGDGNLTLDWETGYAARGEAGPATDAVAAYLHGFDAMVISQERPRRDCPMIQACNTATAERKVVLRFRLASELRNHADEWEQTVAVSPRSSVEVPVMLPFALATDIYHLATQAKGAVLPERDAMRNFLVVARRAEPAGPPKFGFHTFGVSTLGSWPDALPVHWRHMYSSWGYSVGPMWLKDWEGNFGLNPDTPPAEWYWERRIDWAVKEGRKTLVSLSSVPYFPWMREKEYDANYMNKTYPWGKAGGRPNFTRYRQYVHALAERYKGKIEAYELDNESNTISYSGKPAADYAEVMKVAGAEIHAVDPRAKVYGISGTSQFVEYMRDAFATGAAKYVDGVSWHTYTTPMLPGESGLPQMLKRARETIAATGCTLPVINTETGVYTATRETVDQPISRERLAELIKQGAKPLAVPSGWPSYALDEWTAAKSIVQNVTFNFAAGASPFLFFGWDPVVGKRKPWGGDSDEFDCFSIFSLAKDGTMTPSLYTLACAVAMAQMEGVLPAEVTAIDQDGIVGAGFGKANGGQLAVLWSGSGRRTAMLRTACPEIETVSLFGVVKTLVAKGGPDSFLHRIEFDDKPVYLHLKKPGLTLSPSPAIGFERTPGGAGERKIKFTLVNRFDAKWTGAVAFASAERLPFTPERVEFALEPGARQTIETVCAPPLGTARGMHLIEAATRLPDGAAFVFPIEVDVRPSFTVPRLADTFAVAGLRDWQPAGDLLTIDKPEQVAIGRPPELTSLQEERYWKGPDELSAKVATGFNDKGFFVRINVRDKNKGPLKMWPGVEGSCIEWFFDLRSPARGLGGAAYDKGVTQIVAKPALNANDKVELWTAGNTPVPFKGVEAAGGLIDDQSYWVGIFVPWTAVDAQAKTPVAIGFDVAVDAPPAGAPGRKSQIFLFGGAYSNKDASGFGAGRIR